MPLFFFAISGGESESLRKSTQIKKQNWRDT